MRPVSKCKPKDKTMVPKKRKCYCKYCTDFCFLTSGHRKKEHVYSFSKQITHPNRPIALKVGAVYLKRTRNKQKETIFHVRKKRI